MQQWLLLWLLWLLLLLLLLLWGRCRRVAIGFWVWVRVVVVVVEPVKVGGRAAVCVLVDGGRRCHRHGYWPVTRMLGDG